MKSSFHLAKIFSLTIAVAASFAVSPIARANTIAFDTFGPGNTYNPGLGYAVGSSSNFANAVQFTSLASGNLIAVDLGLTFLEPGPVNVFLYGDAAGVLNTASQTFLGSATPTASFASTNNSVVSLSVGGAVPLTLGTTYWLALQPGNGTVSDVWNASTTTIANRDFSTDGGATWNTTAPDFAAAFRLTVLDGNNGSAVPETGSTIALMLGAVGALIAFRSSAYARGYGAIRPVAKS